MKPRPLVVKFSIVQIQKVPFLNLETEHTQNIHNIIRKGKVKQPDVFVTLCFLSSALFYQSALLVRPLAVPHKHLEQPNLLTARIHSSQNLKGQC